MKKVFYIEQEEFLRNALELCFPGECFSLESSSDCFHFLLDVSPRVIVLDAESTDLKEGSFIKLLKEDDRVSDLPIVVTGQKKSWQDYESKIEVSKYFSKPFSLSDLKSYLVKFTND
ncbi:MAG: hypothetical protein VXW15_05510 [Bdellovibrionota bacterium]|jgi:DNA-binding response OmpR family regulator|nr:hypothetical protein [Bdellovibrionota bacterium]|tara:strand:+ start:282 stop:632 length:351 start_codon:yes stop_codon:yes gene_type:complete